MKSNYKQLGQYIRQVDVRNTEGKEDNLLGVSVQKKFIPSIANTVGTDFTKYKVVKKGQFTYIPDTSRRGDKIGIALLEDYEEGIVSNAYTVFEIIDDNQLIPEYLMLWFNRPEFDRYARFKSHGSVREIMDWEEMCKVELPVPSIGEQKRIVNNYKAITDRIALKKQINDNLEATAQAIYKETFIKSDNETWKKGTLSELLTVKYGKDHKHLANGNIPLYGSGGIMRYVEKSLYDKVSVLIPRKGTLSNVMYVDEPFWSVDTMFYTEIPKPYAAKFIYYFVKSKDLAGMDTGSAVPSMSSEIIHSMQLDIPDDETLVSFDNRLNPLYKQMKINNQECAELKKLQEVLLATISSR
ncbi:restriction endonuclease subunit S [Oscillospiraceae bacterium LCP25S3_E3]